MLKPINFEIETFGVCVRDLYEMPQAQTDIQSFRLRTNILKQILRYITNYIHNMPFYFVSNGVEMSMTNQTFGSIWNGFRNKELTDSEMSSSSQEGGKTISFGEKARSAEWRKQDDGYYNKNPNDEKYFQRYYQEKMKQPCVCDICGSAMSCKSNLAKHKETKKCQSFLV